MTSKKKTTIALIVSIGLLWVCILPYWLMEALPVSEKDAKAIVSGMTKAEVKSMLGKPDSSDGQEWRYADSWKWTIFSVYFSADGIVTNWEYDR